MRAAGAITGLIVLGSFVIPGTYGPKQHLFSSQDTRDLPTTGSAEELDQGLATLTGRVYDEVGKPVEGAIVSLGGSGFWPARSVQSQADGRFQWAEIPAGIYELRVSKGQLVAPPVEGLILDAGARRAFGVKLARGWTLVGQAVDARSGAPVHGAEVTVATGPLGLLSRRVESDDEGRFVLDGIVGNTQSLYVEADGYVLEGPLSHAIDSGVLVVPLERAARIEGRVVDARGRPIAEATVRAFSEGEGPATPTTGSLGVTAGPVPPITASGSGSLMFIEEATSGRDGTFALGGLRSGTYAVVATRDDFGPASSEPIRLGVGATRTGMKIVMEPGAELAGRVVDERGRGLEAIPVELRGSDQGLPRMAVTAPDGSFSFGGVRGEVTVTALPYDLPPARATVVVGSDALVTVELTLATSLNTLRGRVVDERGFGIGGALITVSSTNPATPARRNAKSDADGTFAVPALPDPPYALEAEHPAFSETRLTDVQAVEDVRVVMTAGVTLLGEVLDEWTGDGLRDARIDIAGPTRGETNTREDGTFVFRQLPTGTYEVTLSHDDYETQTRRVVVEPARYVDRPQELGTVRLAPGGVVEGVVVDVNGRPVAGAEVTWDDPPRSERAVLTDSRGTFRLRGVPAGSVWISARHEVAGESWTDNPIQVRPLETSPGALIRLPAAANQ